MDLDRQAESTAQRVTQIMDNSPSIDRTTPQQEAARIREQMRHTMAGMEAERKRLGNFCASIGADTAQPDSSRVVMLIEPVPGTGVYSSSMNYIVATDRGFMALRYYPSELTDPQTRSHQTAKETLEKLKQAIAQATAGDGILTTDPDSGYTDRHLRVIHIKSPNGSFTLGNSAGHITEVDTALVEQALQTSINLVRERNAALGSQTAETLAPALAVQKELGIAPLQAPDRAPEEPRRRFGFLRRRG